jgi:hypothetical protein
MSIQIVNSGATIKITENGGSFYIPKPYLVKLVPTVTQPSGETREGVLVIQYSQGSENREWSCVWSDVNSPSEATIQDLVDTIEALQDDIVIEDGFLKLLGGVPLDNILRAVVDKLGNESLFKLSNTQVSVNSDRTDALFSLKKGTNGQIITLYDDTDTIGLFNFSVNVGVPVFSLTDLTETNSLSYSCSETESLLSSLSLLKITSGDKIKTESAELSCTISGLDSAFQLSSTGIHTNPIFIQEGSSGLSAGDWYSVGTSAALAAALTAGDKAILIKN